MTNQSVYTRLIHWLGYDLGITPNQVTVGRFIFFVPGWLIWIYMKPIAASLNLSWQVVGFFAFFLVTAVIFLDIVDGALARATNQVSRYGKILDPLVDKFITYSILSLFWQVIIQPAFLILLVLDICSTFIRGKDGSVEGANEFGKKKALCQNLSKLFFGLAVLLSFPQLNKIGNILILAALILATISVGIRIIPGNLKYSIKVMIPQCFTLANFFCGVAAIWCALGGDYAYGVLFIFFGMGFDLSDGAVARRLGVESKFGKWFDTVADMVTFGISPAVLAIASIHWPPAGVVCGLIYIFCTAARLYDYDRSKDITPRGFFRGFPSPAGAWLVAAGVLWLPSPTGMIGCILLSSLLMCSFRIHWQHFSRILPTMAVVEIVTSLLLGVGMAIVFSPFSFLSAPILLYVFSPLWRKPAVVLK